MKSFASLVVVAIATVGLVSGCAPATSALPDDLPRPTADAGVETHVAATAPTSRVPLRCDQLASSAAVATAAGQPLEVVDPIAVDYIPALTPYVSIQHGDLECAWSQGPLTYNGNPPIVSILVVPEVSAALWGEIVAELGDSADGLFAGDSHSSCTTNGDISECRLDTLANGYWLSVTVTAFDGGATAESTSQLFELAASAVQSAPTARPAWPVPDDAGLTGTIDTALASASLHATVRRADCSPTPEAHEHWVAITAAGYTACTYSTTGSTGGAEAFITVYYLPGGAWAMPNAITALGAQATAVSGLGEGAFSVPDGPGASTTIFARGGDLVSVHSNSASDVELTPQIMTSIATAVAGSLPTA
jgi:hypothetical protein